MDTIVKPKKLDKYHRHLVVLEQSGFRVRRLLLKIEEHPESSAGHSEASILQTRLSQVSQQAGDRSEGELCNWLSDHPALTPTYVSSFHQWLNNNEELSSLEHLLTADELQYSNQCGRSWAWLNIVIYLVLGGVAMTTVLGVSLNGVREMVEQLRIDPPWALQSLVAIQPNFIWVIAVTIVVILVVGWYLSNRMFHGEANRRIQQTLHRAQLADQLCTQDTNPSVAGGAVTGGANLPNEATIHQSPLLWWAYRTAPEQGLNVAKTLGLSKRLFQWISRDRSQFSSVSAPKITAATIGGIIALSTGLALFYPLIQLLRTVIETSGLAQ